MNEFELTTAIETEQRRKDLEALNTWFGSLENKTIRQLCNSNDVSTMRSNIRTLLEVYKRFIALLEKVYNVTRESEVKNALYYAVEEEIEYTIQDGILEELLGDKSLSEIEELYKKKKEDIIQTICERVNFHDIIADVFNDLRSLETMNIYWGK